MNLESLKTQMQNLPNCFATQNAESSILDRCGGGGDQLSTSLVPQKRAGRGMNMLSEYNLGPHPSHHRQESTTESLKRKLQRQLQRAAIYHMQQSKIERVIEANEILKQLKRKTARSLEATRATATTTMMMPTSQVIYDEEYGRNCSEVFGATQTLESPTNASPNGAFVALDNEVQSPTCTSPSGALVVLDNDDVITTPLLSKLYSETDTESESNAKASTDFTKLTNSTDVSSKKRSYPTNSTYVSVIASALPKRSRVRCYTNA